MRPAYQAIVLLLEGTEYWQTKQGKAFKIQRPSYLPSSGAGAGMGAIGGYAVGHLLGGGTKGAHIGAAAGAAAGVGVNAYKTRQKRKKFNQVLNAVKKFGGGKIDKSRYKAAQQLELERKVSQI